MSSHHPDYKTPSSLLGWTRLARLQFHPMAFFAFALGWAAALKQGGIWNPWLFCLGYGMVFCIELGSILINEIHDQPSDRINQNRSLFSGGSGVLVDGDLAEQRVRKAAVVCLGTACVLGLAVMIQAGREHAWQAGMYLVLGLTLGPGYTAPPMRLVTRGLGELNVGFTHSLYLIGFGYALASGIPLSPVAVVLSGPVFFSVLTAIILASLPDLTADNRAGKKTLAVRMGPERAVVLAMICTGLSLAMIWLLPLTGLLTWGRVTWFGVVNLCLGLGLMKKMHGIYTQRLYNTRIDSAMQIALSHILITVITPLALIVVPL